MEPPLLERHVAQWRNRSVIVGESVLGNIETPHTGMPDSWGGLISFCKMEKTRHTRMSQR